MAKKTTKKAAGTKRAPRKTAKAAEDVTKLPRLPLPPAIPLGQVLGQPRALDVLDRALGSGRIHHAWLFHGPSGVGKCTAAIAFAATLLDPDAGPCLAGGFEADPDSRVQRMVREGSHPELHVIRKELAAFHPDLSVRDSKQQNISIHVTRHFLIEPAGKTAAIQGGLASKVFVVDEAELLNSASQNALLKTLEEPPPGTVLILVTSSEDRLLPTIRSRSQRVAFTPLEPEAMRAWLERSHLAVDPKAHDWLLDFAGGSPGQLVEAIEGGLWEWWNQVAPRLDRAAEGYAPGDLGPTLSALTDEWASAWAKGGEKGLEQRSKNVANRIALRRMLALVAHHARIRLRDEASRAWGLHAIESIGRAESLFARSVQPGFVLEGLAADLAGQPMPI